MKRTHLVISDEGGGAASVLRKPTREHLGRVLENHMGMWEAVATDGSHISWHGYRWQAEQAVVEAATAGRQEADPE